MTKPIDDGGPAFARAGSTGWMAQTGMSLRDWFAGMAPDIPAPILAEMYSIMCRNDPDLFKFPWNRAALQHFANVIARWKGQVADAMLAERKKAQP